MAYKNILPTTNLTVSDVRDTLGESTNDIGRLCKSTKINKWAKYKPVIFIGNTNDVNRELGKDKNLGLITPLLTVAGIPTIENLSYTYRKPTGGGAEQLRLGDFRGYCHTALAPYEVLFDDVLYYNYNEQTIVLGRATNPGHMTLGDFCRAIAENTGWRSTLSELKLYFGIVIVDAISYNQAWYITNTLPLYTINISDKLNGELSIDDNARILQVKLRESGWQLNYNGKNKVFGVMTTAPVPALVKLPAIPANVYPLASEGTMRTCKYYDKLDLKVIFQPFEEIQHISNGFIVINSVNLPATKTTIVPVQLQNNNAGPIIFPDINSWSCTAMSAWNVAVTDFSSLKFYSDAACTARVSFPITFLANEIKTFYFKEYFFYRNSQGNDVLPTPKDTLWTASMDFKLRSNTADLDGNFPLISIFSLIIDRQNI